MCRLPEDFFGAYDEVLGGWIKLDGFDAKHLTKPIRCADQQQPEIPFFRCTPIPRVCRLTIEVVDYLRRMTIDLALAGIDDNVSAVNDEPLAIKRIVTGNFCLYYQRPLVEI